MKRDSRLKFEWFLFYFHDSSGRPQQQSPLSTKGIGSPPIFVKKKKIYNVMVVAVSGGI